MPELLDRLRSALADRFLMVRVVSGDQDQANAIVVVENWIEELKAKVKR